MRQDGNDYPLQMPLRAIRSALARSGLSEALGRRYWKETSETEWIDPSPARRVDMFGGMSIETREPAFDSALRKFTDRHTTYHENYLTAADVFVEPDRCFVIGPDRRLLKQSRRSALPLYPSAIAFALRRNEKRLPEAVVYDGKQSVNFYHHVVDGLTNLAYFLERSGLPRDLPLIVNRWIYDSRFFAYLREQSPEFAALNWYVQEPGEWLRVEKAHLMNAAPFDRAHWKRLLRFYPRLSTKKRRRIFLSRDRSRFGRGLTNEEAVSRMLERHGFERIYAEHLTVEQQQCTFEETEVLVALHGMGMIQQMFMDPSRGRVLEIMPRDRIQTEYYWQAWTLGMSRYDVILGSARNSKEEYSVDLDALQAKLLKLLA